MQNHREIGVFIYWFFLETSTKKPLKISNRCIGKGFIRYGLHRGDVHIVIDLKKSKNEKDVPIKPSIGGVKAKRFLFEPHWEGQHPTRLRYVTRVRYNLWRCVHNAITDDEVDGIVRNMKVEV